MQKYIFSLFLSVMAFLFFYEYAHAGFADDWLANSTVNSPSYFEGQKRGYLSAGGFSARWKNSSDYLVTVTPPRIRAGCGGIDATWGGISFLDEEYLVEKLEKILQNAPAVALDLALGVLCQQCANSMKWMEDKANMLNSLQLDDCKASKAIVATSMQAMGAKDQRLNDINTDFEVSSGISKFYSSSKDKTGANGGKPDGSSISAAVADCSAEIRSLFVTNAETDGKSSILTNISKRLGLDSSYAQLLAGMVGDVGIDWSDAGGFETSDIPFCEENRTLNANGLFSDSPYLRSFNDPNGKCSQATDANGNIKKYVSDKLTSIASKMKARSALSSDESAFLNYSSGISYNALKLAVEIDNVDSVQEVIANMTAKDITRGMLNDLYSKGEAMISKAEEIASKQQSSETDTPERCHIELFEGAAAKMQDMRLRIATLRDELNKGYQKELEQMSTLSSYIRDQQATAARFESEVGKRFGNWAAVSR